MERANLKKVLLARRYYLTHLLHSNRTVWVKDLNKNRKEKGHEENLIREMRLNDLDSYFEYFRMHPKIFDVLLSIAGPSIAKSDTNYRESISASERLSITLRYLASGDSMKSMALNHRVGVSTVSKIVAETCQAIWTCLSPLYLSPPNEEEWAKIAEGFEKYTDFPNCVGALDGKHVVIQAPANSGSLYYNHKGSYSMVLMAVCDATYCYTYVDIGAYGKQGDSTIFSDSAFGKAVLDGSLNLPADKCLNGGTTPMPLVFVADEAFPLKKHIMRPYPGKGLTPSRAAFNYRLSRARRMIENTFGITSSRWRILRQPILAGTKTVENIVKAIVCLHNFVSRNERNSTVFQKYYVPANFADTEVDGNVIPGKWRKECVTGAWDAVGSISTNSYANKVRDIREGFEDFFTKNKLSWQDSVVSRG
ncbi:uncharacterized protein [Parasteatoda tepidariorum]|uniref:uncharacterized protein n=1 Tax=Parasteatoda tepidariorum TaxID=114398 RepID=UPI0039BD8265